MEKVIDALVSRSFSRAEFRKSLSRPVAQSPSRPVAQSPSRPVAQSPSKFYKAIELAADTIDSFNDKRHFPNTVYERFFQGYSVKTADAHGIVYTPQTIVDFMCANLLCFSVC